MAELSSRLAGARHRTTGSAGRWSSAMGPVREPVACARPFGSSMTSPPGMPAREPARGGATAAGGRPTRRRLATGPAPKWSAGVLAAVLATALTAWLTQWGIVPNGDRTPPSTTTPATPPAAIPFTVAVSHVQDPCGAGWLVPKAPGAFPDPVLGPNGEWTNWVRQAGAIPAKTGAVLLTLQGRSTAEVTITRMNVRVTERRPAPRGTHVYEVCGDIGAFRWVSVSLDANPPRL